MSGSDSISTHAVRSEEASATSCSENLAAQSDMTDYRIELGDSRDRLVQHPIYKLVNSPQRMKAFMEAHIWAVWDFQSLLKAVQQHLSCVTIPWTPTSDAEARRLINEIVLDEESDELPNGSFASHFELYLRSMEVAGADTGPMVRVIEQIKAGADLSEALLDPTIPIESREFVNRSFSIINSGSSHRIVAAFTYGREDVIPDMFRQFVIRLAEYSPEIWGQFRFYLERHIEHDDEHHGPVCRRIVSTMCGSDPIKWAEASEAARLALEARINLWDAVSVRLAAI
jgi:pyrroloquinoline quinone (PQQ) biosynthesis protein C